jgi:hypothetical protein
VGAARNLAGLMPDFWAFADVALAKPARNIVDHRGSDYFWRARDNLSPSHKDRAFGL